MTFQEFLESEKFEALMYAYRSAPSADQSAVIRAFENVKAALDKFVGEGYWPR